MPITGSGWEFHVVRLGLHLSGSGERTYGTYQVYRDGEPVPTLSGHVCESIGPGNLMKGSTNRISKGRYSLSTHFGREYRTIGYSTEVDRAGTSPMPGICVQNTGPREAILIHPSHPPKLYLSGAGSLNLTKPLDPADEMNFWDSRSRVIDLIDDLHDFDPNAFGKRDSAPIAGAWAVIDGEPMNVLAPPAMADPIIFRGLTEDQVNAMARFHTERGAATRIVPDDSGLFSVQVTYPSMTAPPAPSTRSVDQSDLTSRAPSGDTKLPKLDKYEYRVWYGTNRRPNDAGDAGKGYSADRDSRVHYGWCRVYIPEAHKIGSVGSSWWKRVFREDDRLKLLEIGPLAQTFFWSHISSHLATLDEIERHALIFVHGYNVSFRDAAVRAAQIGFDLSLRGAMAFFSWPSQANVRGYPDDEATIEASEGKIAEFMIDFARRSTAKAVHVIAHSMGNRGVLRAVNRIAAQAQQESGVPFGQIMLAAADVDADTFRELSAAYRRVALRTTLYVSTRDRAVEASRWLHGFHRAGLMPPICIVPGIDTINVVNADLSTLGHGYVASARDVLKDIHDLIRHGGSPETRFGLQEALTEDGERYWVIGA